MTSSSMMTPRRILLLLLWALLGAPVQGSVSRPRMSFPLNSSDRGLVHFHQSDIQNTTTLLLSNDSSTLYVGAQNAILSLDVSKPDVIILKNKMDWSPSKEDIQACEKNKQKNATVDCPNFIHVLQHKNSSHLYACGSYAYTPRDAYLDTQTLALTPLSNAKGRCPFNPFERNTAITVDGELFTGTTDDFWGKEPFISRHLSRDGRPDVRQDTSNNLLEEPTFISSSFDKREGKLYFFFTEVLKEFHFRVELKGARVAQICKDDVGGQRTLQKKWTSFAKSLLLCQTFDILQDMFTLQPPEGNTSDEIVFYGIFTSQQSLGSEWSAVCRFKMEDIRSAFSGDYKTFNPQTHQWPTSARNAQGECGLWNASDAVLGVVKKSFLSNRIVQAAGAAPLISSGSDGVQYRRLVAVTTHAANQKEYTVLFLLTEKGFLHKTVLLDGGPRVLEEVQVFTEPQLVKSLLVSSSNGVVYVGWSGGVTAVPLAHCSSYQSCGQCVLAQDPFCSWDPTSLACTNHHTQNTIQDVENGNAKECPRSFTPHKVVQADLNAVFTLPCAGPSDLATLSWTSARHGQGPLPKHLFMQQLDGGLTFVVTADTLGDYTCTSQEVGYREVQANLSVVDAALEAHTQSIYTVHVGTGLDPLATGAGPRAHDTSAESTSSVKPVEASAGGTADNTADISDEEILSAPCPLEDKQTPSEWGSRDDDNDVMRGEGAGCGVKSYHTELVVVSLLLALCAGVLLLSLLYIFRQRCSPDSLKPLMSPREGAENQGALENDPVQECLVSEVKVVT